MWWSLSQHGAYGMEADRPRLVLCGVWCGVLVALLLMFLHAHQPEDLLLPLLSQPGRDFISSTDPAIRFSGRVLNVSPECPGGNGNCNTSYVKYDWPCVQLRFWVPAGQQRVVVAMDGGGNYFAVFVAGVRAVDRMHTTHGVRGYAFAFNASTAPAGREGAAPHGWHLTCTGGARDSAAQYAAATADADAFERAIAADYAITLHRDGGAGLPGSSDAVEVIIVKANEASYFVSPLLMTQSAVRVYGVSLPAGKRLFPPPPPPTRRIEFFGDSDSNGFGILGPPTEDLRCVSHMLYYQDCSRGYAAQLAQELQAEAHIQAWSGLGIVKNAVGFFRSSSAPLPIHWARTIATQSTPEWLFASWRPDVVVVLAGLNDFFSHPHPTDDMFVQGYLALLRHIAASYDQAAGGGASVVAARGHPGVGTPWWAHPRQAAEASDAIGAAAGSVSALQRRDQRAVQIVSLCGGSMAGDNVPCGLVRTAVEQFQEERAGVWFVNQSAMGTVFPGDYGCLEHRGVPGQVKMQKFLAPEIRRIMGW